jgi:prepilin-type N-terminal cleavage/methylation domain-containing protein
MHHRMLKARAGFTLAEVLVALTLTAVIGAIATGAFMSQSQFFDHQEKVGAARNVSRSAINVLTSEMRMVERSGGVVAASNAAITLRVPYALGLYCDAPSAGVARIYRLPADPAMLADAKYAGYAFRTSPSTYTYVTSGGNPTPVPSADCTSAGIATYPNAMVTNLPYGVPMLTGTPVFLFQEVTYEFKASGEVPGRLGLFRNTTGDAPEELLAPFDGTAQFRFYVNDAATAETAVPALLNTITGLEITLDGLSERPGSGGTHQRVPLKTSIFFRNR